MVGERGGGGSRGIGRRERIGGGGSSGIGRRGKVGGGGRGRVEGRGMEYEEEEERRE